MLDGQVAIVGGGVSGLYAAWRLTANRRTDVRLYEADWRLGGRLLSVSVPGLPVDLGQAELGAMRFHDGQALLTRTVRELGLKHDRFDVQFGTMFLRGRNLNANGLQLTQRAAAETALSSPYLLEPREFGKSPADLIKQAIDDALEHVRLLLPARAGGVPDAEMQSAERIERAFYGRRAEILSDQDWALVQRTGVLTVPHEGRMLSKELWNLGFWNTIAHFMSSEAFLYVHDAIGYESVIENWNAAEAIPWFLRDLAQGIQYRRIVGGFESLASSLEREVSNKVGKGWVRRGHKLVSINKQGEEYELQFELQESELEPLGAHADLDRQSMAAPRVVTERFRTVILALPKSCLADVTFDGFDYGEGRQFRRDCRSVTDHRLFKLFLLYEEPWWEAFLGRGVTRAEIVRSITDLPIRQVYYFHPDPARYTGGVNKPGVRRSWYLIMASYSDARYVDYWHAPVEDEVRYQNPDIEHKLSPSEREEFRKLSDWFASESVIWKAHRQLKLMHRQLGAGGEAIPAPFIGLVKEWPAGWHTWDAHYTPWEVRDRLIRPFGREHLYICGEAFSAEQGWVEGALRSTEAVLFSLGLDPPEGGVGHARRLNEYIGVEHLPETPRRGMREGDVAGN